MTEKFMGDALPKQENSPTAEDYKSIEAQIGVKREELMQAPTDKMSEIVAEIQALESKKAESFDAAHDEAHRENERMESEKAAQAAAREQERLAAEKAALEAERIGKIDEAITLERSQLSGASPEQLGQIVERIKALESQKNASVESNAETPSTEMGDKLVTFSNEIMWVSHQRPSVVAALEAQGINNPGPKGDASPAEAQKYIDAADKTAREEYLKIENQLNSMDAASQEALAQEFFNRTIGTNLGTLRNAYGVYQKFSGTPFAAKFKELESARLVHEGFAPLSF